MVERFDLNEGGFLGERGHMEADPTGEYVRHSDYADLERENKELRADRDHWKANYNGLLQMAEEARLSEEVRTYERDYAIEQAEAAEAENARLRALPLKDERHLTLDEQKTFDVALRNSGTVRQPLPLKDEVERVLEDIVETGTRTEVVRVGDMYADDGYDETTTVSEEAKLASALLSRLRAGEQEGWRDDCLETIENELIDGLEIEITLGEQEYTFNHRQLARRILSALFPASPSVSEGGSRNG